MATDPQQDKPLTRDDGLLPFERIERTTLIRKDMETSPKYGKPPEMTSPQELLNRGIINVNKPSGPTSHQVSSYVQKILGIKKSGHSGTLDPKVTGVLPIAVGKATKAVQCLLTAGKEYICLMHLHEDVDQKKLDEAYKKFRGKIKQLPPIRSAVKRQWRFRKIYYLVQIDRSGPDILIKIGCQAGTYIRKLVHDIGQELGCGAHMAELRRTKAGPFNEDETLCTLQDLTDAYHEFKENGDATQFLKYVKPIEYALRHLPKVWIYDTTVDSLCHGADLAIPGIARIESEIQKDEEVAIYTLKGEAVAFGITQCASKDMLKSKGIAVKTDKVFMEPGTYPKLNR